MLISDEDRRFLPIEHWGKATVDIVEEIEYNENDPTDVNDKKERENNERTKATD